MYLFGCVLSWIFGALFMWSAYKCGKRKEVDYSRYPIADALVLGTRDYRGSRWMVRLKNESGEEVVAADDEYSENTFHPEKYKVPKRGTTERVYYWKIDVSDRIRFSGMNVACFFHFCNEDRYMLCRIRKKRRCVAGWLAGFAMILIGIIILAAGF